MADYFAVTVERNGEKVVTIETSCLSGREISREDEMAIRNAAHILLAFIGDPEPPQLEAGCIICGSKAHICECET